eukprot:5503801-Prymnesium_polylepis.1
MKWSVKPLNDKRVAVPNDFNHGTLMPVFEELVESFDEKNKKVGESYVTINKDGTFSIRTKEKFKDYHNHIGVMDEEDDFDVWEKLAFEKWDAIENPDGSTFVYNDRAVELFKDMVMGLVGDNEEHFRWFMQWNYTNLKYPATKNGRCPFIISKQGVGKDTLVEILQKIFGMARCVTESDPAENIWGKFNEVLQATYLVILTEVGIADFMQGLGRVKHLITQYEYTLNLKGGAKIKKMSTFHRFLGITNIGSQGEITPVPITDDERRFILFYSSLRLKGKTAFWNEMHSLIDDWSAIRSILQYMLTFEHGPMFADSEIPKTEFQRTAVTSHPIKQFIKDHVHETQFTGTKMHSCDYIWEEYKAWCNGSNVQLGKLTKEQFGIKLTRFDIPGVSQARPVKENGKVVKKREFDYAAIRSFFVAPEDTASVMIGYAMLGWFVRSDLKRKRGAALTVESCYRGHKARVAMWERRNPDLVQCMNKGLEHYQMVKHEPYLSTFFQGPWKPPLAPAAERWEAFQRWQSDLERALITARQHAAKKKAESEAHGGPSRSVETKHVDGININGVKVSTCSELQDRKKRRLPQFD